MYEPWDDASPRLVSTSLWAVGLAVLLDVPQRLSGTDFVFLRGDYWLRSVIHAIALCLIAILWKNDYVPFIYFQF
jgi:hypothetical protein